jgi:hypothetical protein
MPVQPEPRRPERNSMSSNVLATTSPVGSLLRAYRTHVRGRNLPVPVSLFFDGRSREIAVQPEGMRDLATQLGNVLLWAYMLSDVTAKWWRTDGERLHVSVRGRSMSGARFRVYGGGHFSEACGLVGLAPDETDSVSLDELFLFLSQLREHRQREDREAA